MKKKIIIYDLKMIGHILYRMIPNCVIDYVLYWLRFMFCWCERFVLWKKLTHYKYCWKVGFVLEWLVLSSENQNYGKWIYLMALWKWLVYSLENQNCWKLDSFEGLVGMIGFIDGKPKLLENEFIWWPYGIVENNIVSMQIIIFNLLDCCG